MMNLRDPKSLGIGMTSQRTRERLITRLAENGIQDARVLDAIRTVPRHLFVDEALATRAYEDTALPIGHGQTISQPWVVAKMSEALLAGGSPQKVLEIGTGCGYQAAVLARLVPRVYSVERIRPLYEQARSRLRELRIDNVFCRHSDGGWGWPENGPYDGILVAAAAPGVPQALLDQLAVGGRMVIPVDASDGQELWLLERTAPDEVKEHYLCAVRFVPLLGGVA